MINNNISQLKLEIHSLILNTIKNMTLNYAILTILLQIRHLALHQQGEKDGPDCSARTVHENCSMR